jgi:plastocyanin
MSRVPALFPLAGLLLIGSATPAPPGAQPEGGVAGWVTILDKEDRAAADVGQAVIWLESAEPALVAPVQVTMSAENKQFLPSVLVIPVGSTVTFPNHDPFNHNVFSLSDAGPFDLGLYGRGEGKSASFNKPGIVRVYCNVHATMSGFIIVRDNPWYTQPGADGSFAIPEVPPGTYKLRAWHERTKDFTQTITVPAGGLHDLQLQLDARGYKYKAHLNKYGQPYSDAGRRY